MGGLEKSQWVTIILIRASTGVYQDHNHQQSENPSNISSSDIGKVSLS